MESSNQNQEESTQARILLATIELIESEGIENITTRSIAAHAGVNIAAINYYFRSKESLVEAALALAWEHAKGDVDEFLSGDPWDAASGLLRILDFFMLGVIRFPQLTQAHFLGYGKKGNGLSVPKVQSPAVAEINLLLERISGKVAFSLEIPLDSSLRARTVRLFSAMFMPVLIPHFFSSFLPVDYSLEEARLGYLGDAVEAYLRDVKKR